MVLNNYEVRVIKKQKEEYDGIVVCRSGGKTQTIPV